MDVSPLLANAKIGAIPHAGQPSVQVVGADHEQRLLRRDVADGERIARKRERGDEDGREREDGG